MIGLGEKHTTRSLHGWGAETLEYFFASLLSGWRTFSVVAVVWGSSLSLKIWFDLNNLLIVWKNSLNLRVILKLELLQGPRRKRSVQGNISKDSESEFPQSQLPSNMYKHALLSSLIFSLWLFICFSLSLFTHTHTHTMTTAFTTITTPNQSSYSWN